MILCYHGRDFDSSVDVALERRFFNISSEESFLFCSEKYKNKYNKKQNKKYSSEDILKNLLFNTLLPCLALTFLLNFRRRDWSGDWARTPHGALPVFAQPPQGFRGNQRHRRQRGHSPQADCVLR